MAKQLEQLIRKEPASVRKGLSIKEFIIAQEPKNEVQKTLAIGYYLEKYEGESPFNLKDLRRGFRKAKEKLPSNLSDKVYRNMTKGHMMEVEERKDNLTAWMLTNSGESLVESRFQQPTE